MITLTMTMVLLLIIRTQLMTMQRRPTMGQQTNRQLTAAWNRMDVVSHLVIL